jgi:hypothetical protein
MFFYKVNLKYVVSLYFRQKYVLEGPKLSNFKIVEPKLQNDENRGTKIAIKPNKNRNHDKR